MRFIQKKIELYKKSGLYRIPKEIKERKGKYIYLKDSVLLNFASNDYLGIAASGKANKIFADAFLQYGTSSSSSRLVSGNYSIINEAERIYARYFGYEDAMFFPSGYQANLALISGLFDKGSNIVFDKHVHSSIIKGIILSRANYYSFRHGSFSHLEKRLKETKEGVAVITESLFSMDGDILDIKKVKGLKDKYRFLCIVDEAHAFGVLGEKGKGIAKEISDIAIGTFGKAFGFFGAFVLMPKKIKEAFYNFSSPVIYSTSIPPSVAFASIQVLSLIESADKEREKIKRISQFARNRLKEEGFLVGGDAQIIPILVGDEEKSKRISDFLMEKGIFAPSIRYPTVPLGKSILRISITSLHNEEDVERLIKGLKDVWIKEK